MSRGTVIEVGGYRLSADRCFDRESHLWLEVDDGGRARCGFDPLGSDTCGDVVAVSFEAVGARVERGGAFGSLEAAKFVGPLIAPVSGTILAHNPAVLVDPSLVNRDPLGSWLVELEITGSAELSLLLSAPDEIRAWLAAELERFKSRGMIAE